MKKEYFILIFFIILLSVYLFLHKENKSNYSLPNISKIKSSDITKINIAKKDNNLLLQKENNNWFINNEKYPANLEKINNMLDIIQNLKLTALVSEKKDFKRYELDPEKSIKVKAEIDSKVVRNFEIGKTAPTYNHTFIKLKNNNKVYYALKNFRSNFNQTVDDLRDKTILSFNQENIKQIIFEKENIKKQLDLKEIKNSDNKNDEKIKIWESKDKSTFDIKIVKNLISMLSNLKCLKYIYKDSKKEYQPRKFLYKVTIKGEKSINISFYSKKEDGQITGISSQSNYPFFLDSHKAKNLISNINNILGIKTKKKN
ncbi:MAG: hypothetical protein B6I26_00180 [Desulfobacteraceae bacterium 4572_130]|nr:MAG: hypothetical protein B6I26_00180 [Desulfobacteraceae bacterium 4572_130]